MSVAALLKLPPETLPQRAHEFWDAAPAGNVRQLAADLVVQWDELPSAEKPARRVVLQAALARLQTLSSDEAAAGLAERLADVLAAEHAWRDAARALMAIQLDAGAAAAGAAATGHVPTPEQYKLDVYLRIVRFLLEDGDRAQAEAFLNRAALVLSSTGSRGSSLSALPLTPARAELSDGAATDLLVRFKASQARVCDLKGQYGKAAALYWELWAHGPDGERPRAAALFSDDFKSPLEACAVCALLADPSAQRTRLLARCDADAGAGAALGPAGARLLRRARRGQLVTGPDAAALGELLRAHHVALGGTSVRAEAARHALAAHNVVAAARVYRTVTLSRLGELLGVGPRAAEDAVRLQIQSGELGAARVDQARGSVRFSRVSGGCDGGWDSEQRVRLLCGEAEYAAGLV